jgi:hypothetical protein
MWVIQSRSTFIVLCERSHYNHEKSRIVIPNRIVRFLEHDANLAFAGTRDHYLVPRGHRVSAWQVGSNRRTLTAFVPETFTDGLIEALEDNGEVALTVEEFPSHETYQFKGRFLRHRPIVADDLAIVDRVRERFARRLKSLYSDAPPNVLSDFILKPTLAVEFEVHDIFVQTPGPGAGARLELEGEMR